MVEIGNSLVVQYLQEALEYLPVLKEYHGKDIGDLIPVIFTMYARYRNATLTFDSGGHVTGYTLPDGGGDTFLKALHILSVESFQDETVCRDIHVLWDAVKSVRFGEKPSHEAFPYVMSSFLVSSPSVCRYSQADEGVVGEVAEYLDENSAERIYEETGRFGLIGDRSEKWEKYSAYIRDPRERFVDQFVRVLTGEAEISYPSRSLLGKGEFAIKSFDTVILNLCADGGLAGQEGVDAGCLVEELVNMRLQKPEMALRWLVLVTDLDFCESERFRQLRERLIFYSYVDSISIIRGRDVSRAVVFLDLTGGFIEIAFKEVIPSARPSFEKDGHSDPFGLFSRQQTFEPGSYSNKEKSFGVPYSIVLRKGCSFLPLSYLDEGNGDGLTEYRVALVGHPFDDGEKGILEENHIVVSCETATVLGPEGIETRLLEDSARPLRTIHAVVMDTMAEYDESNPYKHVGLFNVSMLNTDIPVFIRSDKPLESFGVHLAYLIGTKKDRIFFLEGEGMSSIQSIASEIRARLDARPSVDASVLARYHDEIEAAEWLDPTGEVTRHIAKALKEDFLADKSEQYAQDQLNGLRKCAETIFKSSAAKDFEMLPELNALGEYQRLLMDGEYYDKTRRALYVMDDPEFIPDALNASLKYFVDMTNGASHTADERNVDVSGYMSGSGRAGIYKSCVSILLDLLCWYRSVCLKSVRPRFSIKNLIEETDTVQKSQVRDYFYIGKVHLLYKPGLRTELPASSIRLKTVSLDKFRTNDPKAEKVRYYAKSTDYDIIGQERIT